MQKNLPLGLATYLLQKLETIQKIQQINTKRVKIKTLQTRCTFREEHMQKTQQMELELFLKTLLCS